MEQQPYEFDETVEFKDFRDYCNIKKINLQSLTRVINNLPREDYGSFQQKEEYPEFIADILNYGNITESGRVDFMERIGIRYLKSQFFRKLIDTWSFLFFDGEYQGAYHSSGYGHLLNRDKITDKTAIFSVRTEKITYHVSYPFIVYP